MENWIPSYVRDQSQKKTGKTIDEKGNIIANKNELIDEEEDINSGILNTRKGEPTKPGKEYTPIQQYKPSGNLVYNNDLFEKLEKNYKYANTLFTYNILHKNIIINHNRL